MDLSEISVKRPVLAIVMSLVILLFGIISYTFFRRAYWGGRYNHSTKLLMLDYIFQYVGKVFFHIGKVNLRSRFSIERLGANFVREIEVEYAGEAIRPNFEYCIEKEQWSLIRANILHRIKG